MRARLLDMGEVGAVRTQSLWHAVTACLRPGDDPVALLLRSSERLVALPETLEAADAVDLDECRRRGVPVVSRRTGGSPILIDPGQLLWHLLLPPADAGEVEPAAGERLAAALGEAAAEACAAVSEAGEETRSVEVESGTLAAAAGEAVWGSVRFVLTYPGELAEALLAPRFVSPLAPLDGTPAPNVLAEAFAGALERRLGWELVPSMPTPAELEAVYELDLELSAAWAAEQPTEKPDPRPRAPVS